MGHPHCEKSHLKNILELTAWAYFVLHAVQNGGEEKPFRVLQTQRWKSWQAATGNVKILMLYFPNTAMVWANTTAANLWVPAAPTTLVSRPPTITQEHSVIL